MSLKHEIITEIKYCLIIILFVALSACTTIQADKEHVYKLPPTYVHYCPANHPKFKDCDGMAVIHGTNSRVTEAHVYVRGLWIKGKLFPESQEIFGHEVLHVLQHAYGMRNPDGE